LILVTGGSGALSVSPTYGGTGMQEGTPAADHRVVTGDLVLFLPYEDHGYRPDPGGALQVSMIIFELSASGAVRSAAPEMGDTRHFQEIDGAAVHFLFVRRRIAEHNEYSLRAAA
jgi:hypothetical protein